MVFVMWECAMLPDRASIHGLAINVQQEIEFSNTIHFLSKLYKDCLNARIANADRQFCKRGQLCISKGCFLFIDGSSTVVSSA